jgi:hypothetical protein
VRRSFLRHRCAADDDNDNDDNDNDDNDNDDNNNNDDDKVFVQRIPRRRSDVMSRLLLATFWLETHDPIHL